MKAVIYQHETNEDEGLLGPALKRAGFELVRRFRGAQHADVAADLVVVLGARVGVYESDHHPFVLEERAVLAERLASAKPCLGICFGAQLLASAAGAENFQGKNGLEVGVGPVRLTRDAAQDPVFKSAHGKLLVAHWHGDTFGPVPDATLLGSTDRYTQQAFRIGRSYGLQFHLELTADAFRTWLQEGEEELQAAGKDVAALHGQLGKLKAAEADNALLLERLAWAMRP